MSGQAPQHPEMVLPPAPSADALKVMLAQLRPMQLPLHVELQTKLFGHRSSDATASSPSDVVTSFLVSKGCPPPSRTASVFVAGKEHSRLGVVLNWLGEAFIRFFSGDVLHSTSIPEEWEQLLATHRDELKEHMYELQGFGTLLTFIWSQLAGAEQQYKWAMESHNYDDDRHSLGGHSSDSSSSGGRLGGGGNVTRQNSRQMMRSGGGTRPAFSNGNLPGASSGSMVEGGNNDAGDDDDGERGFLDQEEEDDAVTRPSVGNSGIMGPSTNSVEVLPPTAHASVRSGSPSVNNFTIHSDGEVGEGAHSMLYSSWGTERRHEVDTNNTMLSPVFQSKRVRGPRGGGVGFTDNSRSDLMSRCPIPPGGLRGTGVMQSSSFHGFSSLKSFNNPHQQQQQQHGQIRVPGTGFDTRSNPNQKGGSDGSPPYSPDDTLHVEPIPNVPKKHSLNVVRVTPRRRSTSDSPIGDELKPSPLSVDDFSASVVPDGLISPLNYDPVISIQHAPTTSPPLAHDNYKKKRHNAAANKPRAYPVTITSTSSGRTPASAAKMYPISDLTCVKYDVGSELHSLPAESVGDLRVVAAGIGTEQSEGSNGLKMPQISSTMELKKTLNHLVPSVPPLPAITDVQRVANAEKDAALRKKLGVKQVQNFSEERDVVDYCRDIDRELELLFGDGGEEVAVPN